MTKKQKTEMYELFAQAFHEVVMPLFDHVASKEDIKNMATKDDLKQFATKDDLKREIGWVRDDINGLKADLVNTVSREEHNQLKAKVDKYLTS